jgi:hypothetical protein
MYGHILEELTNTRFNENPFSTSHVITCAQADRYGQGNGHIFATSLVYQKAKSRGKIFLLLN